MKLSEKIAALRKKQGISQEELAERLGVSRQTVSRWENGTAAPDVYNLAEISKVFGVTSDYLLNEAFDTDDDLPQIKTVRNDNHILHLNLAKIAIIAHAACLNAAMRPFSEEIGANKTIELLTKLLPILLTSVWMSHNLKYENDAKQYRKNVIIEFAYCAVQAVVFLFGHFSEKYLIGTILLLAIVLIYVLFINPKYMNRPFVRKKHTM